MYEAYLNNLSRRDFLNNINISLVNRYVYLATGKVANSTIKYILQTLELEGTPFSVSNIHDRMRSPLLAPYQLPEETFRNLFEDSTFITFAFVRNPYTRLLSAYLDRICRPTVSRRRLLRELGKPKDHEIDFAEFLDYVCRQNDKSNDPHWRPQSSELLVGVLRLSFVGRFENFQHDARDVLTRIFPKKKKFIDDELSIVRSPSANKTATQLVEYYSDIDLDLVLAKYGKDFDNFDYSRKLEDAVESS